MTRPTFTHKFFGWLEAEAYRHTNPDGSEGGIVAVSATVASGVKTATSVQIGPRAIIGHGASIGPRASIGDGARVGYGASISDGEWFISCGPQGSRNAMLTAVQKPEGLRWWIGCKTNITTEKLREYIGQTHGDNHHAMEYLHVISFIETHPGRIANEKKEAAE